MLQFNIRYFIIAVILFFVELWIAMYMHDKFIRPFFGDFLVVILIYCFVKAFVKVPVLKTAIAVLIFSYIIETLQYFKIVKILELQHSKWATIIIGTSFEWIDILCYTLGIVFVLMIEKYINKKKIGFS